MEQQAEYQMPEIAKVGFDHRAVCGLAPRLAKAMEAIDKRLEKRGFNKEFKFEYATAEDVKAAARSALAEQQIAVIPMIREVHPIAIGRKDSPGMRAVMDFIVACPEGAVTVPWHADAMDFGDKAINKCVTIGLKVFLIALLQIPTGDEPDPDANGTGNDEPETARRGPAPKRRAKSENGKDKSALVDVPDVTQDATGFWTLFKEHGKPAGITREVAGGLVDASDWPGSILSLKTLITGATKSDGSGKKTGAGSWDADVVAAAIDAEFANSSQQAVGRLNKLRDAGAINGNDALDIILKAMKVYDGHRKAGLGIDEAALATSEEMAITVETAEKEFRERINEDSLPF